MESGPWQKAFEAASAHRLQDNLLRSRHVVETIDPVRVRRGRQTLVNFSSNDYLGLAHHPDVMRAVAEATKRFGAGSGASALITGYTAAHASAERTIARWKGTESAILLPSGYQTNHAIVQTLAAVGGERRGVRSDPAPVRFLIDKLCHASLIDAIRATESPLRVFPHNGIDKLARLLTEAPADQLQVVVTESIFSMDGNAADLRAIVELRKRYGCLILLDEAHGGGVYGHEGAGYAHEIGVADQIDVTVATFSKALGLAGGAVCASNMVCEAVVNHGRAYIYSTAVPPALAVGIEASLAVLSKEPRRADRVRRLATRVRQALSIVSTPLDSSIIPIPMQSETAALAAATALEMEGMLVTAIRPPTVPRGGSRLRVTLSCEHSDEQVEKLIDVIKSIAAPRFTDAGSA